MRPSCPIAVLAAAIGCSWFPCAATQAAEQRDLLTAEEDYRVANLLIGKVLADLPGLEFATVGYERWYNGNRRTSLPDVVVAVKSTLSTSRSKAIPYEGLFTRDQWVSVTGRDQDITVFVRIVRAELLYLRVADTTVFVSDKLRQMASDPPTLGRLKILCVMGKIPWDMKVRSRGALERAMSGAYASRPNDQPNGTRARRPAVRQRLSEEQIRLATLRRARELDLEPAVVRVNARGEVTFLEGSKGRFTNGKFAFEDNALVANAGDRPAAIPGRGGTRVLKRGEFLVIRDGKLGDTGLIEEQ